MASTILASQVARRLEQDGLITDMTNLHAGPKRYFKKRSTNYTTGNDDAMFAMRLGYNGAKGTYTRQGSIVGYNRSVYATSTYQKIQTKVIQRAGFLKVAGEILPDNLGGKDRNMVDQFSEEVLGHFKMWANDWNITFFTGASEAIFRIADDPNPSNVTGNQWRVYVDTTKDARFLQNVYSVLPGHHVAVAVVTTHAQLDDGSNDYKGVVRSIAEDGLSMIIEWEQAMANTATDLTNSHFVRFDCTTDAQMGKYGLYDFVGNTSSAYVNNAGTATNAFPYHSGETSIDPDTYGEWSSIIFNQAGSSFSVEDFDKAHEKIQKRNGVGDMGDYVCFGSPEIETQLIQENRLARRWQAGAKSMDQTPDGRRVFDSGMVFEVDSHCPDQQVYMINTSHLANDTLDDKGPGFANAPTDSGSRSSQTFTQVEGSDEYYAHTKWHGQRMTLQRNKHLRIEPTSGGS